MRDSVNTAPWRGGLEPCGDVSYELDASCIAGKLPAGLRGTLYRAGPGRIRVAQHLYGHWFDGDGAVRSSACVSGHQQFRCAGLRASALLRWHGLCSSSCVTTD